MPKEDRSDWVAVEPQFQAAAGGEDPQQQPIRKTTTAYQFFQRDAAAQIREEYGKVSDIAQHGRLVKEKWQDTSVQKNNYISHAPGQ